MVAIFYMEVFLNIGPTTSTSWPPWMGTVKVTATEGESQRPTARRNHTVSDKNFLSGLGVVAMESSMMIYLCGPLVRYSLQVRYMGHAPL